MSAAAAITAAAEATEADRATHFAFAHKVFRLDRAHFALEPKTCEPVFHVRLGELNAVLPFPTLRAEFSIDPGSPDGQLLAVVEKGLRFVKEIRPGDSIPRELLDGSASWNVDEKHRVAARRRVLSQLAMCLQKDGDGLGALFQSDADAAARQRLQEAVAELAEKIGLGREKRQLVLDRVEGFAREYTYIEALRDRFGELRRIVAALTQLTRIYKHDAAMLQEVTRVHALLRPPIAETDGIFTRLDEKTADLPAVLKSYPGQIRAVRDVRDDVHFRLQAWDEIIPKWQDEDVSVSVRVEALIKETYRFAAFNFPQTKDWRR